MKNIVKGIVTGIEPYGIFVKIDDQTDGLIHISEISSKFVRNPGDFAKIGEEIEAEVLETTEDGNIKLSIKSFGIVPKINQKPNKILLDFQKDIMDCKSCNDNEEEMFEEYLLFSADTEKTTPNPEDLQDLLNCRKKMIKFRNSINYSPYCEYENILNFEKMLNDIQDENEINHGKKKSIWNKYIKDQLDKDKEKSKNYFKDRKSTRLNSSH